MFIGYLGPMAIVLLVLFVQIKCFHEVIFYISIFTKIMRRCFFNLLAILFLFPSQKLTRDKMLKFQDHHYRLHGLSQLRAALVPVDFVVLSLLRQLFLLRRNHQRIFWQRPAGNRLKDHSKSF